MAEDKSEWRPEIPADVQRVVLTEAGHKCAVCGEPCPLERAHIIPWRKSKLHTADNLICLCANCHQRADNEHWGEKTLRIYKKRPWVLRRESQLYQLSPRQIVTLRMEVPFAHFDRKTRRIFIHSLAGFLDEPPESIKIMAVERGSTTVTIELSLQGAAKLVGAVREQTPALLLILGGHRFRRETAMRTERATLRQATASVNGVGRSKDAVGASSGTTATVTKQELIDRIAELTKARRVSVKRIIQTFLDEIIRELCEDHRLEFRDFGVFETKKESPRITQGAKMLKHVDLPVTRTVRFKLDRIVTERLSALTRDEASKRNVARFRERSKSEASGN